MKETGRYVIEARLKSWPCYNEHQRRVRRFVSLLERDEYQGWKDFHCKTETGAIGLEIRPLAGGRWESKDERWDIISVRMISREEYAKLIAPKPLKTKKSK